MKKVFGILFLIWGIIGLPGCLAFTVSGTIGRLIGNALITFLPAYLLLRNKNKEENEEKN